MNKTQEENLCRDIHKIALALEKIAKAFPSAEQEAPDINVGNMDTISRQAAIEALRKMQTYKLFAGDDMILIDKAQVQTELMMLPSVQPKQNEMIEEIRKWINSGNRGNADYFIVDKIEEIINAYE